MAKRDLRRQRGWAGILLLLVVVLIVAFLAKDALLKYLGPAATTRPAAASKTGTAPSEPGTPASTAPMDRARDLQGMMQKESEKRGGD